MPTSKKPMVKSAAKKNITGAKTSKIAKTLVNAALKAVGASGTNNQASTKLTAKVPATAKKVIKTAPAKTTATGLAVSGNKKIGTLMKEFNKQFPYLRLKICYSYVRQAVAKGESISGIDVDKTLASVRRADSGGDISISGNKKIKSLEKEFDTVFGLYVQVCYTDVDGHRYYTSGSDDEKTLASFNSECEKNGCKKGVWK